MEHNYFTSKEIEWLRKRRGKITSSEYWMLTIPGSRPMTEEELAARPLGPKGGLLDKRTTVPTMFGETALTYIEKKATEICSSVDDDDVMDDAKDNVKSLKWGKQWESAAVDEFRRITGKETIYHGVCEPVFYEYGDFAGGSPDGTVVNESAIVEIKCPINGHIHSKRLRIKTLEEFIATHSKEWHQCQMNMHIMGKDYCYFGSFDPRRIKPTTRMKIIKVPKDQEWAEDFEKRLDAAIGIMADIIENDENCLFIQ